MGVYQRELAKEGKGKVRWNGRLPQNKAKKRGGKQNAPWEGDKGRRRGFEQKP